MAETITDPLSKVLQEFWGFPLPGNDFGWAKQDGELLWVTPSGYGAKGDFTGKLVKVGTGMFLKGRSGDGRRLRTSALLRAEDWSLELARRVCVEKWQVVGKKKIFETVRSSRKSCRITTAWEGPADTGHVRFILPDPFVTY